MVVVFRAAEADVAARGKRAGEADHLVLVDVKVLRAVVVGGVARHNDGALQVQGAVVPDAAAVGVAGVARDADRTAQVDGAFVNDAATAMLRGGVAAQGAARGAAEVEGGTRFDKDAAGVLRGIVSDVHVGEGGRAAFEVDGTTVAFVLFVAACGKSLVVVESAVAHGETALVPDGTATGFGSVAAKGATTEGSGTVVDETAATMLRRGVVADGVGTGHGERGIRLDIDAAGVFRGVVGDNYIGQVGRATFKVDGAAVAFILFVAANGKSRISVEGAVAHGEAVVAPDGAAARGGGVAAQGAVGNSGRAFVHDTAAAGIACAVADGAARDVERGIFGVHDAAAVVAFAAADGDIVDCSRAFVHDASGGVGAVVVAVPAAAEGAVGNGEIARRGHDDDATHIGAAAEVAPQGVPAKVDGNRFASRDGDVRR